MKSEPFDVHKHDMEEGIRAARNEATRSNFTQARQPASLRKKLGRMYRYFQGAAVHPRIVQLEKERDDALKMFKLSQAKEWRAIGILAALNDLQSNCIGRDIDRAEFLKTWEAALKKTPQTPPRVTLKQLEDETTHLSQ